MERAGLRNLGSPWSGAVGAALCLLLAAGCGRHRTSRPEAERAAGAPEEATMAATAERGGWGPGAEQPTRTEMRNVDLRILEGATLRVRRLSGEAVALRRGQPVGLDEKTSYLIRVESGEASIDYPDLSRVMNEYTFGFDGAPVKRLELSREEDPGEGDEIQLKGRLRKVLGIPFEIEGRLEPTPDGKIRIRTTSIQALDVKVGGLMHALGLEPKDLLGGLEERGVRVDGNDMILDPARALPPPRVAGRVTSVQVQPEGIRLIFGAPAAAARGGASSSKTAADKPAGKAPARSPESAGASPSNFLAFRGGTIRIGKMTQRDAELRMVDQDPRDPLDLYVDRMTDQLVAGYAKLSASGGLTIFVPDYGDMRRGGGSAK
jgi:hypothetical protein